MTDQLAELLDTAQPPPVAARQVQHPQGWEPGVAWDGSSGTLTTGPLDTPPDPAIWAELVKDWDLDPAVTTVVPGSVQVRGWDAAIGDGVVKRMRYYRATLQAVGGAHARVDVDQLCREIRRRKPGKRAKPVDCPRAMVVGLSDWQVGKGEGDGSAGTVDRILGAIDALVERIREHMRMGRPISHLYLCGLGDLIEQCMGHYAMQAFSVDLDRREQVRVVRRLLLALVDAVLSLVPQIVLVAVPGNHGENRNGSGKSFTTFTDNDDLAVFEQLAEILAANPDRYGHVSVYCANELSTVFEACGVVVGLAHMHQGRAGSNPQQKVENWWAGHALGRGSVADADLLLTGHYHHLMVSESTGRTWFQMPALDPGSAWFREGTGRHSPTGLFVVGVGECYGTRKWGDMVIL